MVFVLQFIASRDADVFAFQEVRLQVGKRPKKTMAQVSHLSHHLPEYQVCLDKLHVCLTTVKSVYNGHCISRSPLYNSQVTESQMGLQCAFQPALTGHLSITATFLGPKGDHYRQVSLYYLNLL